MKKAIYGEVAQPNKQNLKERLMGLLGGSRQIQNIEPGSKRWLPGKLSDS
jgi:hypothetical protein